MTKDAEAAPGYSWRVKQGASLVGTLFEVGSDFPWILCRFEPGPGWEAVRPWFEAWEDLARRGFPEGEVPPQPPLKELGIILEPLEIGEPFRPGIIWLASDPPKFRSPRPVFEP
ncbi:hypothetical protein [Actinomadura nitritigenes]|uniref:hypothetical protein n=1 Tax=Actinomadura nitritigenes TaxID=134602 RepID=UPI003D8C589F